MQRYDGYSRILASGAPAPSATVTVYNAGTLDLATIYSDNLVAPTPLGNPFTADVNGYFFFYAQPARYDINFSAGGIVSPYTWGDQSIVDPIAAAAAYSWQRFDLTIAQITNIFGTPVILLTAPAGFQYDWNSCMFLRQGAPYATQPGPLFLNTIGAVSVLTAASVNGSYAWFMKGAVNAQASGVGGVGATIQVGSTVGNPTVTGPLPGSAVTVYVDVRLVPNVVSSIP
jgi:hypothetical protein